MLSGEPYSDTSDDETREETVGDCRGAVEDSDIEIDETEDPLKHAGIYTSEEVTLLTRDKLIKLQSLYAEYLNVLKRRYGRKRVEFRKRVKIEKETIGPLRMSAITSRQKLKLEQLELWRRYHRRFGEEALLHQQSQKRRRLTAGTPNESDSTELFQLCNALVNGMDCAEMALPNSSMCAKHILCDSKQVLFFKCDVEDCRNVCIPVADTKSCWFHQRNTDCIRHDLALPMASFGQGLNLASIYQRSSVFSPSAPPLRIFPPTLTNGGSTVGHSPTQARALAGQKSSGNVKAKKRSKAGSVLSHGRRDTVPSTTKRAPGRIGLVLQPPSELRSAPPLPASKKPSFVDMSAEAGVYGAYMTSTEPSDGRGALVESGVAGIRIDTSTAAGSVPTRASL